MEHRMSVKGWVADRMRRSAGVGQLAERVAALEEEVADYRSAHVRYAELLDVVTELLVPMAQQDQSRINEVIARYTDELDQES